MAHVDLELDDEEELLLMAHVQMGGSSREDVWFIDSGCSNHMTGNKKWFISLDENFSHAVKLGNNARMQVMGQGSVKLRVQGRTQIVSNVFYVPDLTNNLLSVGQLLKKGLKVVMQKGTCKIFHPMKGLIVHTHMITNRMFVMLAEQHNDACLQVTQEDLTGLWHRRFGHLHQKGLQCLEHKQMVEGMPKIKETNKVCEVCSKGKQHRDEMPKKANWRASEKLQLIHSDLCGPITPTTMSNKRYILTFIDDFSRKTWIYLLAEKGETFEKFRHFKTKVEKETGMSIKCLRSDRGGEYTSQNFLDFCSTQGIKRQLSTSYTPQQNGVAERKNRTLMNMVRCLLVEGRMPRSFWAEAATWSVHIINRSPTAAVTNKTPEECWTGHKPNVAHFKIFGCVTYVHVPNEKRIKLEDKSYKCVFLGVSEESKAYRLYDPESKKIVTSRDVIFAEEETWNWGRTNDEELTWDDTDSFNGTDKEEGDGITIDRDEVEIPGEQTAEQTAAQTEETRRPAFIPSSQENRREQTRRISIPPRHLHDYVTGEDLAEQEEEEQYLVLYAAEEDPVKYDEAVKDIKWRKAMDAEIQAIEKK
jgi:transposase InsO family protein